MKPGKNATINVDDDMILNTGTIKRSVCPTNYNISYPSIKLKL